MQAELLLKGSKKAIKVLDLDYGFTQFTDETGKTSGYPTGGTINLVVESTEDTQIIDWMISPTAVKSGKIEIQLKKKKVVRFENAFCVQYHESYSHMGGDQPMSISFTLSAEGVYVDGVGFFNKRKS